MFDIEWTGTSYTDQIDNLEHAFYIVCKHAIQQGIVPATAWQRSLDEDNPDHTQWQELESKFCEVAFKDWMEHPDNVSLIWV